MASPRTMNHTKRGCGGVYEIKYSSTIPYLSCDTCGHKVDDWVKWQDSYKHFWRDDDKWGNKKDHLVCLLGLFANLYWDHYGVEYTFSLHERGLFSGTEAHHIRRVYGMFNGDPLVAREYIEWIFDNKVQQRKRKITSLGFLATAGLVQEFKLKREKERVVSRSTPLPAKMLLWAEKFSPEVFTLASLRDFGELKLLLTYYKQGHYGSIEDVNKFIGKLIKTNYIDREYNISNWRE